MNKKIKKNNTFRPQTNKESPEIKPSTLTNVEAQIDKILTTELASIAKAEVMKVPTKKDEMTQENLKKEIPSNQKTS